MHQTGGPTKKKNRAKKRASRPLRTTGALLGLLGLVGVADHVFGLASPHAYHEPLGQALLPLPLAAGGALVGLSMYWLGRRWQ